MVQSLKGPRIFIDPKEIALKERLEKLDREGGIKMTVGKHGDWILLKE